MSGGERAVERAALLGIAGVEAGLEPLTALFGAAVREALGVDLLAGRLQDAVVADGLGGAQRLLDLAGAVEQLALGDRRCPGSGEAVRLQFEGDAERVGRLGRLVLELADPVADAGHILDVVAILVGHDVLRGQITGGAEFVLELLEEVEVEVHELVHRAVERPDLCRRPTAAGLGRSGEEDGVGAGERALERLRILALPVQRDVVDRPAHDLFDLGDARGRPGRFTHRWIDVTITARPEEPRQDHDRSEDDQPDDAAPGADRHAAPAAAAARIRPSRTLCCCRLRPRVGRGLGWIGWIGSWSRRLRCPPRHVMNRRMHARATGRRPRRGDPAAAVSAGSGRRSRRGSRGNRRVRLR